MPARPRFAFAVLCLIALAWPTAAQYGPGNFPTPPGGEGNNPQPPAGQGMAVPDYIKPGFQMLYMTASSSEGTDEKKPGSAGMGFTEYTVIAVAKDKVLVTAANYLTPQGMPLTAQGAFDPNTDPKAQLIGANSFAVSALDVQVGNAMWMPVDQLKQMQSGNGVEVQRGPWPYNGQQVGTTTITVKGTDSISSNTFRSDNGQKLVMRSGTGAMRRNDTGINPYNRKHQSQMQLLSTRQLDLPTIGADWPAWSKTVKKMNYSGTYSMAVPGTQVPPVQMSMSIAFTDRGEGYVLGKSSIQVQGNPAQESVVMQGAGSTLGYWVHPEVLAKINPGTFDENKTMRTTLSYQVQDGNLGRLGVFVLTNESQSFYAVSAYNLQNGALTYISLHTAETGVTIEFALDGME